MGKITRLLATVSILLALTTAYVHYNNVMGKVPSVKIAPASFEVISLAFTLSDVEVTGIKARV